MPILQHLLPLSMLNIINPLMLDKIMLQVNWPVVDTIHP